jgi:hypothetical protein
MVDNRRSRHRGIIPIDEKRWRRQPIAADHAAGNRRRYWRNRRNQRD